MLALVCAVVGVKGCLFTVEIKAGKLVGRLKKAIKHEMKNFLKTIDVYELELYLAKKDERETDSTSIDAGKMGVSTTKVKEGVWLPDDDQAAQDLDGKVDSELIETMTHKKNKMKESRSVGGWLEEMNMPAPRSRQIHVLVVISEGFSDAEVVRKRKLSSLGMMLKQCEVVGDLPKTGEFLKIFEWTDLDCGKVMDVKVIDDIVHFIGSKFYVRKEVLCVLENFRKIYQSEFDSGEMVDKQFVLMGSPGTGKSCILALLCFFIAIKVKRPVLWLRQVAAGRGGRGKVGVRGKVGGTTTRLFYQGKYYEWQDPEGTKYRSIYDALNDTESDTNPCWFVLDGLDKRDIKDRKWFDKFTLLATSGQFPPNSVPVHFFRLCLVPYWKQSDLEAFGQHMQMEERDVDARLFVSGGSLGNFLDDDAEATVKPALDRIKKPEDAEILLTKYRLSGSMQNDHVRMRGVYDRINADHYVDVGEWTGCVASKLVLHHLAAMMKPYFFEELMRIATGMRDDRLEDITFEAYFHSLVYHRRSMSVEYCKYDNVDRETVNNWENIMRAGVGSIEWKELSVIESGENTKECVAVMESWAAKPSKMDYWIPATSLCETIDAVAKLTFPDNSVRFCFLQLTKAATHKCNADFLWDLAQPFVDKKLDVCYIALVPDEDKRRKFRLSPVQITKKEVLDHIPLYVAHFKVSTDVRRSTVVSLGHSN